MEKSIGSEIAVPRKMQHPGFGKSANFQSVDVYSNHYNFKIGEKGMIYQWDVKYEPELEGDSREVRNEIFKLNRKDIIGKVGQFIRTGDILFTFSRSNMGESMLGPFGNHPKYKLWIKDIKKTLSFDNIDASDDSKFQIFKVLNSGVKSIMRNLGYTEFGFSRKFYDLSKVQEVEALRGKFLLDVKSGFFTSIDLYQNKIPKIMIDCSSRIVRQYSMWEEYEFFRDERNMSHEDIYSEFIEGRNFLTSYGNNRVYRIDGIDMSKTPMSEFPNPEKGATFKKYFAKQYGVQIEVSDQFLAYSIKTVRKQVGGETVEVEEKVYLIPELLKPTGLTDELRKDFHAMRDIAKFTKLTPNFRNERQNNLISNINGAIGVKTTKGKEGLMINELSLKIDPSSNRIKGKLLDFPLIKLSKPMRPDKGNFQIRTPIYDTGAKLSQWLIVCNELDLEYASTFAHKLKDSSKDLGITVENPKIVGVRADKSSGGKVRDSDIIKAISSNPNTKIALVFLPKKNADRVYKRVKAYCNQEAGIASQFFTCWEPSKTDNIYKLAVASKVLMQMCAKLKVKLWKVQTPKDINVNGHQTMIVGADVFHKNMHQSVTSVVSTYDKDFSSYYSQTSVQKRRGDDTLYDIADKVKLAARRYVKENKAPPNIIIVYRDGVGQGQVDRVREKELKSLIKGLQQEFNGHNVKLAYIIVTKRLSDRFFTKSGNFFNNPEGGLIVDTHVVKDNTFEYFMVAQAVNQGTATPTNYNVIFNNTDLKAETFYELTYNQCYSYYNWSGPLKVPAVIMMANKVADLIGQTHSRDALDTVESLKDSLFFL